jgi:hypothetical protein
MLQRSMRTISGMLILFLTSISSVQAGEATSTFDKLGFGLGLSLTTDTGSTDRIDSASLVNGVIRADVESQTIARVMLETHYFFSPTRSFLGLVPKENWGIGPFVGIVPGEKEIITATALGIMVGFLRDPANKSKGSWNLGIGYVVDPKVKTLGDGLQKNLPLPAGETEIRFKEQTQKGMGVIFSASF